MSDANYKATVVTLKDVRKHSNADRLQCVNIFGNNIIIGLDAKDGDTGLYFPLESQLGAEFAVANDLIRRKNPETGKPEGGMFDENRRVRAQTFRGERSMGFWLPLSSLEKLNTGFADAIPSILQEGNEIDSFNGFNLCSKYVPKFTNTPGQGGGTSTKGNIKRFNKVIDTQFRFHTDTAQLGKNMHKIDPQDHIVITYKYHGTSAIAANVIVKRQLNWYKKILAWIANKIFMEDSNFDDYGYLYASRTVVKNQFETEKNHFYGEDLWTDTGKKLFEGKLHTGESIYYEIVGYTSSGKAIQGGYNYGCSINIHGEPFNKAIIYRITSTAKDGTVYELPWSQVQARAKELGVESALLLYSGNAGSFGEAGRTINQSTNDEWRDKFLKELQDTYLEKDCVFHPKGTPAEGICVRVEKGLDLYTYKLKSFRFLEGETKALDKGEIDLETEQS